MISYEVYKILHLFTLFLTISSLGFILLGQGSLQRMGKISVGVVSFLIFVAGMGLIARLGFRHGEAFPFWILVKIAAWILVNALLIVGIKVKSASLKKILWVLIMGAIFVAVYAAIYKPILE